MTISTICLILFLLLQLADAYTTIYGIRNGLKEATPTSWSIRSMASRTNAYIMVPHGK